MMRSLQPLWIAAAALLFAIGGAGPASASPGLATVGPLMASPLWSAPALTVSAAATPDASAASASKTDLRQIFVAVAAARAASAPQSQAHALVAGLRQAPGPQPLQIALAQVEAAPVALDLAAAPDAPALPVPDAPLEAAARPDEPLFAEGADAIELVSLDELDSYAGGTGLTLGVLTNPVITGVATGNTINGVDVSSGGITIATDAFSGYDGIGNFVINSGHNNVLQSTVNVSIVMTPP